MNKGLRRQSRELQPAHLNLDPAGQDLHPDLEAEGSNGSEGVAAVLAQKS